MAFTISSLKENLRKINKISVVQLISEMDHNAWFQKQIKQKLSFPQNFCVWPILPETGQFQKFTFLNYASEYEFVHLRGTHKAMS